VSIPKWLGVLVGTSIDPALASKIAGGYRAFGSIPIAALTIKRYLGSNNEVYVVTDTYFSRISGIKDTSKYLFDGVLYGKGRLVLAVVKRHVESNPSYGFQALLSDFPVRCQGSSGVFAPEQDARSTLERTKRARHFLSPQDLVKLSDVTVAVSNQWGVGNIGSFLEQGRKLGYKIQADDR
jgi:hypothetical protein